MIQYGSVATDYPAADYTATSFFAAFKKLLWHFFRYTLPLARAEPQLGPATPTRLARGRTKQALDRMVLSRSDRKKVRVPL